MKIDNARLPKGWEVKKLGEVCEILNGGTPKTGIKEYWYGNIKWITPKDMGKLRSKYVNDTPRKITSIGLGKSSAKIIPIHSVILSTRAPIGHLAINTSEMATNQGCRGIVPSKFIDALYLHYFLNNSIDLLNSLGTGATFKELSRKALASVQIPAPPLPEQKRIVKILDKAFQAIDKAKENAEKNLQNAKELFESYLNGIFVNGQLKIDNGEWEEKRLGEVCTIIGGGTPAKKNEEFYKGDISWATVRDMKQDEIINTEYKITDKAVSKSSTNIVPKENVIIATRVGLGKVCIVKNDTAINQDLKGIIPKKKQQLSVYFLFRWFKSISNKIIDEGTGATVQGVKLTFINSLKISLPSIDMQKQTVQKLDQIQAETKRLEKIYQQKIADVEELKKSVLQKAFEGEL